MWMAVVIGGAFLLRFVHQHWQPRGYFPKVYGDSRHRCLARFLAAFRRRSFFFRHFHRCFPCFFQAREPLFIR